MSFFTRLAQTAGRAGREVVDERRQRALQEEDAEYTRRQRAAQEALAKEEMARTEAANLTDGVHSQGTRPNVVAAAIRATGGMGNIAMPGTARAATQPFGSTAPRNIGAEVDRQASDYRNLPSGGYVRVSETPGGRQRAAEDAARAETTRRGELAGRMASSYPGLSPDEIEFYRQNPEAAERLANNQADFQDDLRRATSNVRSQGSTGSGGSEESRTQAMAQARREAVGYAQTLTTNAEFPRSKDKLVYVRTRLRNQFRNRLPEGEIQGIAFEVVQEANKQNAPPAGGPRINIDPSRIPR